MSDENKFSQKPEKKKISIVLIEIYVAALDELVAHGIYESRGEIVQEGLRPLFRRFGMPPFVVREPEKSED